MEFHQLLREWPPGFGGVERVAHELGNARGGVVFSLDVQRQRSVTDDPLPVAYQRVSLRSIAVIGRFHLPLPSKTLFHLLFSQEHLHGHLPSPGVLLILVLARCIHPKRTVSAHWHCFLTSRNFFYRSFFSIYQHLALSVLPFLSKVVTTSPILADVLRSSTPLDSQIVVLPCCLSEFQESSAISLPLPIAIKTTPLRVLFIGRLDSYKRLDWVLDALSRLNSSWTLSVIGDGTKRQLFEEISQQLFAQRLIANPDLVQFHGRLSEELKYQQMALADLLVLPSDCSNEAFGIVQLEAMAAGRPSLAFNQPRSGMGWVCQLPSLSWSQTPEGLVDVLERLANQPALRSLLAHEARDRYLNLFSRSIWCQQLMDFVNYAKDGSLKH